MIDGAVQILQFLEYRSESTVRVCILWVQANDLAEFRRRSVQIVRGQVFQ